MSLHNAKTVGRLCLLILAGTLLLSSEAFALAVSRAGANDSIWNSTDQHQITYCVNSDTNANGGFGANYALLVRVLDMATSEWEAVADVDFIHVVAQDSTCTNSNLNVQFNVSWVTGTGSAATSFYPDFARSIRQILVDSTAFSNIENLPRFMRHELGHALGFVHEHVRPEEGGSCPEAGSWRALTDYDSFSVMHYPPPCGGTGGNGTLSHWDKNGAACIYGAAPGFDIDPEVCGGGGPIPLTAYPKVEDVEVRAFNTATLGTATILGVHPLAQNRVLIALVYLNSVTTPSDFIANVFFNSTEQFTKLGEIVVGATEAHIWYLINPSSTPSDVIVSPNQFTGQADINVTVVALSGASQNPPTLINTNSCTNCNNISAALTSTVNNTLLLTLNTHFDHLATHTHGVGQVELSDYSRFGFNDPISTSAEVKATAGLETLSTTASTTSTSMLYVVAGIEPDDIDTEDPTVPTDLVATAQSDTSILASWMPSTDNSGIVSAYHVEFCDGPGCVDFVEADTTQDTDFVVSGLITDTLYRFRVRASDQSGNFSGYSNIAEETTFPPGCVDFVEIGTSTSTQFTAVGLTPNTSYRYRVRAEDASTNFSGYTGIAEEATQSSSRRSERGGGTNEGGFFE